MFNRRTLMAASAALVAAGPAGAQTQAGRPFVEVDGIGFRLGDRPYRFVGANIWYGAYLGAETDYGDRDRLRRELDRLKAIGATNLRVLGSSEDSPLRSSMKPTFRTKDTYNEDLLKGLDFLLAEMARRDMKAVIYLTNFWEWSGGMATYLYWTNSGHFIDMNDPAHPWPDFPDFTSGFYASQEAVGLYHDWIRHVVGRTNTVTQGRYADDPTIMSWQLCNEPRPGGRTPVAERNFPDFYAWIASTAGLIKSLAPNHLVSTGGEGLKGCVEQAECVVTSQTQPGIDYTTAHIWPQNWSWVDPADLAGTHEAGAREVATYINQHVALATRAGKPLVIEEFGYPRDGGSFDPAASTEYKDRYYRQIYDAVMESIASGGPLQGSNFWSWSGEGRASHADHRYRVGDRGYVGDPPHEPQGWYGVFNTDDTTLAVVREHAAALASAG